MNNNNSIVCEPNEDSVKESVDIILNKLKNNEIIREKIRIDCINKMNNLRLNFINKTDEIFKKHNINIDSNRYFNEKYFHKMCKYYDNNHLFN